MVRKSKQNELPRKVKESMYRIYHLCEVKPLWKYRSTVSHPQLWYIKSSENKVFGKIYLMVTLTSSDVRIFSQFISLSINSNSFPWRNINVFDLKVLPWTPKRVLGNILYMVYILSLPFYNPKNSEFRNILPQGKANVDQENVVLCTP